MTFMLQLFFISPTAIRMIVFYNHYNNNNNSNKINNNNVAALPGGMLGARSRLRPLPLSLVGWCASYNNNNKTVEMVAKE